MRIPIRILVFALALGSPLGAQEIDLSSPSVFSGEPSIAVSADGSSLVASYMSAALGVLDIRTCRSTDGGATWTASRALPHSVPGYTAADPSVVFDPSGVAHVAFVDFAANPTPQLNGGRVVTARSTDGGATWGPLVTVFRSDESSDQPIDRPWLAVDMSPGPRRGTLYAVTMSAFVTQTFPHHIRVKSSTDGGNTWSTSTQVDDAVYSPGNLVVTMGAPSVGPDGALWIAFPTMSSPGCEGVCLAAAVSCDGGVTFSRSTISNTVEPLFPFVLWHALAANPARGGAAAVVWVDGRVDRNAPDILLSRSSDGGASWSAPQKVNDNAGTAGHDLPWLAFTPGGLLGVVFRDRRNAGTTSPLDFEIWTALSTDGGATFSPNQRLSSALSVAANVAGNDFLGVAFGPKTLHAVWGDHRSSLWQVYTNQLTTSGGGPTGPLALNVLLPCRLVDTRDPAGPRGGPALAAGAQRTFRVAGVCGLPASARCLSVNLTVTGSTTGGDLRVFSADQGVPDAWSINFSTGQTRANNGLLRLSDDGLGGFTVQTDIPSGMTHLIVDVNGYFE